MFIRFTTSVAGANFSYRYNQKVDLPPHAARRFLDAGLAVPMPSGVEEATRAAPERAVARRRGRRGGASAPLPA